MRPPAELIRSLVYDAYFEDEAPPHERADGPGAAGGAGGGEGGDFVLVGGQEEPEESTGEEDAEWQGRDVYWWARECCEGVSRV